MRYELNEALSTLIIEDGPAKGQYRFHIDSDLIDGRILNLGPQWIGGREVNLKIDLEKNLPELLEEMNRRKAELRARIESERASDLASDEIDRRMAQDGFSSGSKIIDRMNRLNPNKF